MLRVRLLSAVTALVLTLLLMTGLSGVARADTLLIATLTNDAESPPVAPIGRPPSSGNAMFILNDERTAMRFFATIVNIDVTGSQTPDTTNDNLTAAHIHATSTIPLPPTFPVVWGFFGAPFNENNPNDAVVAPFATGVGGMFSGKWDLTEGQNTTLTAQIDNILNGRSYINFHTVGFGGGEIRGTLTLVPEPSSIVLLLVGIVGAVGFARRQISLT